MKKLTLIAVAATMVSLGAYGQGLINFNNSAGATSHISVNTTTGGAATGQFGAGLANNFYFALFYSTTATTVTGQGAAAFKPILGDNLGSSYVWNDTNWHFAGGTGAQTYNDNGTVFTSNGYAVSTASAGRVLAMLGTTEAVAGLSPAGATAQFVVVGWSSNIGTTWGAVQNWLASPVTETGSIYLGESSVGAPNVSGDNNLNAANTILAATVTPAFVLGIANVPEPSTMALAALGGLSLLLFRRRQ
jgi:hypothetical protein